MSENENINWDDPMVKYRFGLMLINGDNEPIVKRDVEKGVDLVRQAAEELDHNGEVQDTYGMIVFRMTLDPDKAMYWINKAYYNQYQYATYHLKILTVAKYANSLRDEVKALALEGQSLTGLFAGKRRKEIENRLANIMPIFDSIPHPADLCTIMMKEYSPDDEKMIDEYFMMIPESFINSLE